MNRRPGWIKLYNQTLESDFWIDSDEPFDWRSAFIHILLSANWKPGVSRKCGHTITIERGQYMTSIRKLMSTFHWGRKRVEEWLRGMSEYGMLTSKSFSFGTLLTVVKYDFFQLGGATVGHTEEHTEEHTDGHAEEHTEGPRSKTIDNRQQTEDSQSPACAGTPSAEFREPPIGSPEWLELHYDD